MTSTPTAGSLAKDVAIYGLGDAVLRGLSVIAVPIFTRIFTPDDYGVISLLVAFGSLFGLLHDAGMASAAQRHYFDHQTTTDRYRATTTAFWFVAIWGMILVLLGLLLGNRLATGLLNRPDATPLIWLVIGTSFLAVIAQLVRSYFRLTFRPWPFAVTALVSGIAMIGFSVLFVLRGDGLMGYFWGGFLGMFLGLIPTLWLGRTFLRGAVAHEDLRAMLFYGVPLVPAALASFVFDLSDRFFLARLTDFHEVGLYAVGYSVVSLLSLMIGAFAQA
ncbi:oligosaccharide flippase family protein, partial [Candidatus Berkelbacteria bacterium]|nr:oligosaccharide flippase family protein [Candidatus Berkelbacteria bacterium]